MIVVWRVTGRCNLSCPFCAYDRTLSGRRLAVKPEDIIQFASVLGEYRQSSGKRLLISWIGGEPLLWPPLFDVSRRLNQDFGIELSATTNGTTLHTAKVQNQIIECFSELTVSVDGLADFHDELRRAPGNWQQTQIGVRALSKANVAAGKNLKLRANIVLMRDNISMLAELCHTLADWGLSEITFNQLGGRDRPEFFPAHCLRVEDVEQLMAILPALRAELSARDVRLCGSAAYLSRIEASAHDRTIAVSDCAPGEHFLFIDEFNRVAPCNFTSEEYSLPLSSICTLDDLLHLPQKFSAARQRRQAASCSNCPSTQVFAKFVA